MPGLMARILSRRADGAPPPVPPAQDAAPAQPPAPGALADGAEPPLTAGATSSGETAATTVLPALAAEPPATPQVGDAPQAAGVEAGATLPAAADPEPGPRASFRSRGPLRRRLRYLRRVRELGFRDLGGLVFDLDRFGRDRADLVRAKLDALRAIDSELRTLESVLADPRPVEELHEPGVSACLHCGGLHGSEARFCPSCGVPVGTPPPRPIVLPATAPQATAPDEQPTAAAEPVVAEPEPAQAPGAPPAA